LTPKSLQLSYREQMVAIAKRQLPGASVSASMDLRDDFLPDRHWLLEISSQYFT
jgi:hypothetical protein